MKSIMLGNPRHLSTFVSIIIAKMRNEITEYLLQNMSTITGTIFNTMQNLY